MKARYFSLVKKTGTYADALAAMGLGRLLYLLSGDHPTVRDEGWAFVVGWSTSEHDLAALNYEAVHDDPGYKYMLLKPPDTAAPGGGMYIDYTQERELLRSWREQREVERKAHGGRLSPEAEDRLKDIEPMAGWYLYQNLNVLQGYNSYNGLHHAIRASDTAAFAASVRLKLAALLEERDPADVATEFAPKVSAVQAFNPAVGKGTNRPKPDGPALASLPGAFVDWFEEWLRYIGVHLAANALSLGDDIKFFVMVPADLDEAQAQSIRDSFVSLKLPWSPAKVDILGALGLVEVLINRSGFQSNASSSVDDAIFRRGTRRKPSDIIAGLQTAYFTSLGSARSLTNTAFIGLPGWFDVVSETIEDWHSILVEHKAVIQALEEDRSEELALLVTYRDFLSAGERGLNPLLAFLADYAAHLIHARDRKQYAPSFTTTNHRRLFMSMTTGETKLRPILDDEGFKHVAAAIRRATVNEQSFKARGQQVYEIHYGLFQDLERKARFTEQFIAALSAFVTDYNTENAKIAERRARATKDGMSEGGGRRRPQVTTSDLDRIITLVDTYGSEPVAMLLLAYGSARDDSAREGQEQDEAPAETAITHIE